MFEVQYILQFSKNLSKNLLSEEISSASKINDGKSSRTHTKTMNILGEPSETVASEYRFDLRTRNGFRYIFLKHNTELSINFPNSGFFIILSPILLYSHCRLGC
jgi:hypothetical protein